MPAYLGTLGRLVPIRCNAQEISYEDLTSIEYTLEGKRKAQVSNNGGRREWGVGIPLAHPGEAAKVMAFRNGEWGNGPFVWIAPDAPVTNLLTPDAASCAPGAYVLGSGVTAAVAGPMLTPDGWAGRSYSKGTENSLFFGVDRSPVIQGQAVTASAYVLGDGAKAGIAWYDSAGLAVGTAATSTASGTAGTVTRSSVTAMPPVGAVSCRPYVNSPTTQTARPALTWTDSPQKWDGGQGCNKAIITERQRGTVLAAPGVQLATSSFTITEVG